MRDKEFYDTSMKDQTGRKQQRIKYLSKVGKLETLKVYDTLYYNEEQFRSLVCAKGEIPLTAEEFSAEPFLFYAEASKTTTKAHYAFTKLGIPKYMNMQNFRACFKMNDIFTVEIRDIAKWYNIPEDAIKQELIKLWARYNKEEKIHNRTTFEKPKNNS